ncbi:hypothetical protein AAVH_11701 [Aphelenchoides avenae]|nr:hypothetical protein AAVH_11701 [Aphelenchus avenae]
MAQEPTTSGASDDDDATLNLDVPLDDSVETPDSLRFTEVVLLCGLVPLDSSDYSEQPLFDFDDYEEPTRRIKPEHRQGDNGMVDRCIGRHEDHTYASPSPEGLLEDHDNWDFIGGAADPEAVDGAAIDLFSVKEPPPELCFKADELERIGRRPFYRRHAKVEARKKIFHEGTDKWGMALFERIVNRGVKNRDLELKGKPERKQGRIHIPSPKSMSEAMRNTNLKGRKPNSNQMGLKATSNYKGRKPNSASMSSGDSRFASDSE